MYILETLLDSRINLFSTLLEACYSDVGQQRHQVRGIQRDERTLIKREPESSTGLQYLWEKVVILALYNVGSVV